ncbi:hypothetical protein JMJ56_30705 [Belnapia sp. T18]|uniref:Transposase IS4-like domain-containing protein n=1 Tax=Belnapia arida TaxID=2804533 RepID=A0ABS1UGE1_9PROT|nr:transposase [Belnapia arida]MBL6082346.1 hypothetical protein [Belnapia arida]
MLAHEAEGRKSKLSAAIIDNQTVRATSVDGVSTGYDTAKWTFDRKRHILVDAAGFILLADADVSAFAASRLGSKKARK